MKKFEYIDVKKNVIDAAERGYHVNKYSGKLSKQFSRPLVAGLWAGMALTGCLIINGSIHLANRFIKEEDKNNDTKEK